MPAQWQEHQETTKTVTWTTTQSHKDNKLMSSFAPGHFELVEIDMASERPRHVHIFTISGAICSSEEAEPESGVKFPEMRQTPCIKNIIISQLQLTLTPIYHGITFIYLSLAEDVST